MLGRRTSRRGQPGQSGSSAASKESAATGRRGQKRDYTDSRRAACTAWSDMSAAAGGGWLRHLRLWRPDSGSAGAGCAEAA